MLILRRIIDGESLRRILLINPKYPLDVRLYVALMHYPLATYTTHAKRLQVSPEAIRRSRDRLVRAGWVYTVHPPGRHRGEWLIPWMPSDVEARIINQLAHVRNEIHRYGEWLMKCILDLIIHERVYHDNARNQWLIHPETGGRLELDRWYPTLNFAFEFQGPQHFGVDGRFIVSEAEYEAQAARDRVKRDICARHGVELIEITAADLDFQTISARIRERNDKLPLFPIRMESPLVREVLGMCRSYSLRAHRR